ncbi:hypothetical protein LTR08_007253 [Meristemomyces frigidus]|nr:hypothetical protein LTR08_007253 [Meristemomyces frigidus]
MPSSKELMDEFVRASGKVYNANKETSRVQQDIAQLKQQTHDAEAHLTTLLAQTRRTKRRIRVILTGRQAQVQKADSMPTVGPILSPDHTDTDYNSEDEPYLQSDIAYVSTRSTGPTPNVKRRRVSKDPDVLNAAYPTVVLIDGQWTEISCDECGANAGARGYFGGVSGLCTHKVRSHKSGKAVILATIIATCRRRLVSNEDVELIRKGGNPAVEILKILPPPSQHAPASAGPLPHQQQERDGIASLLGAELAPDAENMAMDEDTELPHASILTPTASAGKRSRNVPAILSAAYPSIVLLDDQWTEIWCEKCGANAKKRVTGDFFNGMAGLQMHMYKLHKGPGTVTLESVVATCKRRVVEDEDVDRIRAGRAPVVKIEKIFPPLI